MKVLFLVFIVIGAICAQKRCIYPMVNSKVGEYRLNGGALICNQTTVDYVLGWGINPNYLFEEDDSDSDNSDRKRGYYGNGYYYDDRDTETKIKQLIYSFLPNGKAPVSIVGVSENIRTETIDDTSCFDADTIVNTPDGIKAMSELVIGDAIQISPDEFMNVTGWFHRDDNAETVFITLITPTAQVTLSEEHILKYSPNCDPDSTNYTTVGEFTNMDCLVIHDMNTFETRLEEVYTIQIEKKRGVYAPYIASDEFLVFNGDNGVYVTPYAIKMPDDSEKTVIKHIMRLTDYLYNQQEHQGINKILKHMIDISNNYFSGY